MIIRVAVRPFLYNCPICYKAVSKRYKKAHIRWHKKTTKVIG